MVRQAKVSEEHRVDLVCHNNPKEFFGYVSKHEPRAPLGPVHSSDGHLETVDEEMAMEFNNIILAKLYRVSWVAASARRKRERSGFAPMRQNATKAPGAPTPGTRKSAGMICPGGLRSAPGVTGLGTS